MPKRVATMKDLNELSEAVSNAIRETGDQLRETRRFIAGVDETISSRLAVVEKMVNALEDQEFSGIYDRLAALERQVAGSDCEPAGLAIHDQQILEDFAGWLTRIYFVVSPSDSNRIDFNIASWSEVDKQPEELIRQYREYKG